MDRELAVAEHCAPVAKNFQLAGISDSHEERGQKSDRVIHVIAGNDGGAAIVSLPQMRDRCGQPLRGIGLMVALLSRLNVVEELSVNHSLPCGGDGSKQN